MANFLAHIFEKGYQYRSLNSFRSAISSTHDRVDGVNVGQHPIISRLMAGALNSRPPQPRYNATWDVQEVLVFLENMGSYKDLSLKDLTIKTAMLLALTRPSRSADLCQLDLSQSKERPEGFTFHPTVLPKQARAGRSIQEFFFPRFSDNKLICPVEALNQYVSKTESLRSQGQDRVTRLFIGCVKPHKPVTSSTVARWLKTVLEKTGIDVSIFKAHSTRSASVSAAANLGITTKDILQAADWKTESVFQKFYYKPVMNDKYGRAILAKGTHQ